MKNIDCRYFLPVKQTADVDTILKTERDSPDKDKVVVFENVITLWSNIFKFLYLIEGLNYIFMVMSAHVCMFMEEMFKSGPSSVILLLKKEKEIGKADLIAAQFSCLISLT